MRKMYIISPVRSLYWLLPVLCLLAAPVFAAPLVLVQDGTPQATLVLANQPTRAAQFAAAELQYHVEKITGAELPIVAEEEPVQGLKILVGASKAAEAQGLIAADFKPQEYLVRVGPDVILLIGRDKEDFRELDYQNADTFPANLDLQGTVYAAYEFLEKYCDVRWYWPTELCMVHPEQKTLTVTPQAEIRRQPELKYRAWNSGTGFPANLWNTRTTPPASLTDNEVLNRRDTRLFWLRTRIGGEGWVGNHTFNHWGSLYADKPDWYGVGYPQGTYAQPCMTNPEVIAEVVKQARDYFDTGKLTPGALAVGDYYAVVPNDTGAYCKCPKCQALLKTNVQGSFSNESASNLVFQFVNAIAREVRKTHPDKWISTLAYASYAYPPDFELEPNVVVGACMHARNYWAPKMQKNDEDFLRRWADRGTPLFLWTYTCFPQEIAKNGGFYCFPAFQAHMFQHEAKFYRDCGVQGIFCCGNSWYLYDGDYRYEVKSTGAQSIAEQLDTYLMFKLFWDADFDVDAAMDEYFTRYYGAAGPFMKELYQKLEATYMTPSNYPPAIASGERESHQTEEMAWGYLGTEERMAEFGALIEKALAAPTTPVEKQRLENFKRGCWDYMVAGRNYYLMKQELRKQPIPSNLQVPLLAESANGDPAQVDWTRSVAMERFRTVVGEPTDRVLSARFAQDGKYLYLQLDEGCDPRTLLSKGNIVAGDYWELMLAWKRNGPYQRFLVNPAGDFAAYVVGQPDVYSFDSGAKVVSDTSAPDHWLVRVALPLDKLLPHGVKPGQHFYANLIRTTREKEFYVWLPMPQGFRDIRSLGSLGLDFE
jgi:hypothetical protein